ncbi:unnamed protein product, partial [Penicillium olsonii]
AEATRPESIDQDRRRDDKKPKSRRPANTAFRQQRLKAWQPILTPKSVLPLFFIVGIVFAPIGGVLLWASSLVQEISIDYSDCSRLAPLDHDAPVPTYSATFKSKIQGVPTWQRSIDNSTDATTCTLRFYIPDDLPAPVFMYYRLTNFYQNHRRYVQSLDLNQLKGDAVSYGTLKGGTCDPLAVNETSSKPIYPCGLIANSMFNDSIGNPQYHSPEGSANGNPDPYNMTKTGIAWQSDKELIKTTKYTPEEVSPPPNWGWALDNGSYTKTMRELQDNEDFLVWMRTAGLPSFSKLSRRNDNESMSAGLYSLAIVDYFNVTEYSGTKSILISTRTALGGKNPFMGIAYVVVGGVCVLLGALFTVAHLVRPRKLGDHTYLTWDSNQPSTGTATGRDDRFGNGP